MHKLFLFFFLGLCVQHVVAQKGYYTDFEKGMDKYFPITSRNEATYVMELQRPQWVKGVLGRALDLSANAVLRKPLLLDSLETPLYEADKDLTVCIWVRTLIGAIQGTPIVGNNKDGERKNAGWSIHTQKTGAWAVTISDGKNTHTYKPNVPRQAINDGEWHQLAFSLNREKGEVWYFLDGKNVAIYNVAGLGSLKNENPTVIGGTHEYMEYGSYGQWNAFNGYIDEVNIINNYLTADNIKERYNKFKCSESTEELVSPIRTMVWNIWHGGRRYGKNVGVQRIVETIKEAQPDVIGLIETYGSGEIIADSLGYYFYLISSNLSIMSRFPIKGTIKAFRSFNFGGVVLDLGNDKELVFLDTWLHYLPDYSSGVVNMEMTTKELIKDEGKTRHSEIKSILKEIEPIISNNTTPIIMLGDFNVGSHLDWTSETQKIHYGYAVEWPVSIEMEKAGFKDSYREMHIDPLLDPGFTWTPRAATSSTKYGLRDRIDYIYFKGNLRAIESKVVDYHPIMFPSDHAGVVSVFEWVQEPNN